MSIYQCPKGHASTESDYCSECGTKIQGISEQSIAVNTLDVKSQKTTQNLIVCPACTAPHDPSGGNFCEICGYNFSTGAHGEVPPIEDAGTGGLGGEGEKGGLGDIMSWKSASLLTPLCKVRKVRNHQINRQLSYGWIRKVA